MTTEADLQQAWIDTRMRVLKAIDSELNGGGKANPGKSGSLLELAEAYAWLTRPDQPHKAAPRP